MTTLSAMSLKEVIGESMIVLIKQTKQIIALNGKIDTQNAIQEKTTNRKNVLKTLRKISEK